MKITPTTPVSVVTATKVWTALTGSSSALQPPLCLAPCVAASLASGIWAVFRQNYVGQIQLNLIDRL